MSKVQLRKSFRNNIYNYRPNWIIKYGISAYSIFLLLIITSMGYIKYPDTVPASVEISTINPPSKLISKISSKIDSILVKNNQFVKKGHILASLRSTTSFDEIINLELSLQKIESILKTDSLSLDKKLPQFNKDLLLGELQREYSDVQTNYNVLNNHCFSGIKEEQQKILLKNISTSKYLLLLMKQKRTLSLDEYKFIYQDFHRDSSLYLKKIISASQYDEQQRILLQSKKSLIDLNINIEQIQKNIQEYDSELTKSEKLHLSEKIVLTQRLITSIQILQSQIEVWKNNYLLICPIDGIVSYTTFWNKNQNVKINDVVFSVVPMDSTQIKVRLQFPIKNSGKVQVGQQVNIRLQNYPYHEFGILIGHITSISEVPNDFLYSADVTLKNGLMTSYNKNLPKMQNLTGEAEILTSRSSLILRIFNPLKAFWDNQQNK